MASRDSANNKGQGVRTGPKVSLDVYSDSSNHKRQPIGSVKSDHPSSK